MENEAIRKPPHYSMSKLTSIRKINILTVSPERNPKKVIHAGGVWMCNIYDISWQFSRLCQECYGLKELDRLRGCRHTALPEWCQACTTIRATLLSRALQWAHYSTTTQTSFIILTNFLRETEICPDPVSDAGEC